VSLGDRLRNLRDFGHALGMRGTLGERERWPRERLEAHQHARFAELVAWASRHSSFHRRLYGGPLDAADVRRESLPIVTKTAMMAHFDEYVTDPRVRRDEVERHLATLGQDDAQLFGAYRVMASSGSSGRRGLYVWDRPAWSALVAASMRWMGWMGVGPRLPRWRVAQVAAPDVKHMTARGAASSNVGVNRMLRIPASRPLPEVARTLEAFRPELLTGYPSAIALLAQEQLEGRLHIAPRVVSTTSELCTSEMAARICAAWGAVPFDCYAMTETGITATSCPEARQRHLYEDLCVVEVVDEAGRAVPAGTVGARVLVTNLANRVQPFIRFEVTDLLTVDPAPCPCGRTLRRLAAVEGRSDDVLSLPAVRGGRVAVHPIHLRSPLAARPEVVEYQIVHDDAGLEVLVVAPEAPASLQHELARTLDAKLRALGVTVPLRVQRVAAIAREDGAGKLKLVKARAGAR
jgi:phenylacetate-CoA ligase